MIKIILSIMAVVNIMLSVVSSDVLNKLVHLSYAILLIQVYHLN